MFNLLKTCFDPSVSLRVASILDVNQFSTSFSLSKLVITRIRM